MINLTLKGAKAGFFDRSRVIKSVDAASRRVLSRFGSFVRQRAKSSIRNAPKEDIATGLRLKGRRRKGQKVRDAVSKPGQPPYSHAGLLRTFLFFAWDQDRKSVVIGPARINRPAVAGGQTVPELMEYGGRTARKGKSLRYAPHPFMRPAFNAELPGLPPMWRDSIRP